MKSNGFNHQINALNMRLNELFDKANQLSTIPNHLATDAFKELGFASEELQVIHEEFWTQNEKLENAYQAAQAKNMRYQSIFELLPEACLITSRSGKIEEINLAAAQLLRVPHQFLPGKILSIFVYPEDLNIFNLELTQLQKRWQKREWELRFRDRLGEVFYADVTVTPINHLMINRCDELLWSIRDITERKRVEMALTASVYEIQKERSLQIYEKGEIIPFDAQGMLFVCEGLVKLSTFCENNEEILVGLIGPSMPFGCSLTSLPTYQAIALSQVKVASVSLEEFTTLPSFVQIMFEQMSRRLQQTESLLANFGRRNVEDRLQNFLLLLKQEVGEPVPQGTRLKVRLTHQDIANACGTSRVTVTRLLNKFKKEKIIAFDSQHHLIVLD